MLNCINIEDTQKVQMLQEMSGLSDFPLRSQIRHYTTLHNRLPQLDELDGANSEPYLRRELNIEKGKSSKITDLLDKTGTKTPKDAVIYLNNKYRDLEITYHPLNDSNYYLTIKHRPKVVDVTLGEKVNQDFIVQNNMLLDSVVDKLANLYGIKINEITQEDLASGKFNDIPNPSTVHGFIKNGQIYVVKNNFTADTKLHEMLHLILGSVKYQNRDLYDNLIGIAFQIDDFNKWASGQKYRTQNDLAEEYMVTQLAKYLTGNQVQLDNGTVINKSDNSIFYNVDKEILYQTMYHMNRLLDTVFMGDVSVKAIPNKQLYNFTIREVANIVNSAVASNSFQGSLDDAMINRIGANFKSLYMKKGRLIENCK